MLFVLLSTSQGEEYTHAHARTCLHACVWLVGRFFLLLLVVLAAARGAGGGWRTVLLLGGEQGASGLLPGRPLQRERSEECLYIPTKGHDWAAKLSPCPFSLSMNLCMRRYVHSSGLGGRV